MERIISEDQWQFGEQKLKELAEIMEVDERKAIHILQNIRVCNKFYDWVHADTFLNLKQCGEGNINYETA